MKCIRCTKRYFKKRTNLNVFNSWKFLGTSWVPKPTYQSQECSSYSPASLKHSQNIYYLYHWKKWNWCILRNKSLNWNTKPRIVSRSFLISVWGPKLFWLNNKKLGLEKSKCNKFVVCYHKVQKVQHHKRINLTINFKAFIF